MSLIIGLAGRARSGKDTVAAMLEGYHRVSFADPIKDACRAAFGLTDQELYGSLKETPRHNLCGKSPRQVMQWFGTEFARDRIGSDVWLRQAARRIEGHPRVVIPDCRFENEALWIKQRRGFIVLVERPGIDPVHAHSSESGLPSSLIDFTIQNLGGLEELKAKVDQFIEWLERTT